MRIKRKTFAFWVCAFLPLIAVVVCFPTLPNMIPAHFGFTGKVDRIGSKYELYIVPIITILFAALMQFSARYSDQKSKLGKTRDVPLANAASVNSVGFVGILMFIVLTVVQIYSSYPSVPRISIVKTMAVILSISLILMGNLFPKCKRNALIGIRVSWTLDNDEVWFRTHRFGGKVFIIGGLISTFACIFAPDPAVLPIVLAILLILTVIACVYAHNVFYKLKNN